ncbi:MAG TPA: zinc ABC transporter substrate-binding protein [Ktedonobacteraceae bacterium]|nr:zinc ABC transporter substrate-binding protein [Ktedonobacteraceae bacterium]
MRIESFRWVWVGVASLVLLSLMACSGPAQTGQNATGSTISVVAAENFYGDIVKQLGGTHVSVTSILTDPTVDPHQYESNVQNAIAVSKAQLVIENGEGYDSWMDKLLSAAPADNRTVLIGSDLAHYKLPHNPHVWYGVENVRTIAQAITADLKKRDSQDSAYFDAQASAFGQSLDQLQQRITSFKAKYAGTPVGLTEDIFLYQAEPLGLNVLTPAELQQAVAEGNDPPAQSVIIANSQITQHQIKVLIYNLQTVTPVTTNLQNAALKQHIPIVGVTETMPTSGHYQQWMLTQLQQLENAIKQKS